MFTYDFENKEALNVFDSVKYIISNNTNFKVDCPIKDCKIIEAFDTKTRFVGYPVKSMGKVIIANICISGSGVITADMVYDNRKYCISIHKDFIYVRK